MLQLQRIDGQARDIPPGVFTASQEDRILKVRFTQRSVAVPAGCHVSSSTGGHRGVGGRLQSCRPDDARDRRVWIMEGGDGVFVDAIGGKARSWVLRRDGRDRGADETTLDGKVSIETAGEGSESSVAVSWTESGPGCRWRIGGARRPTGQPGASDFSFDRASGSESWEQDG